LQRLAPAPSPSPRPYALVFHVHPKFQICVTDEFLATDAFLSTRSTSGGALDVPLATQGDSPSTGKMRSGPENHTLAPLVLSKGRFAHRKRTAMLPKTKGLRLCHLARGASRTGNSLSGTCYLAKLGSIFWHTDAFLFSKPRRTILRPPASNPTPHIGQASLSNDFRYLVRVSFLSHKFPNRYYRGFSLHPGVPGGTNVCLLQRSPQPQPPRSDRVANLGSP